MKSERILLWSREGSRSAPHPESEGTGEGGSAPHPISAPTVNITPSPERVLVGCGVDPGSSYEKRAPSVDELELGSELRNLVPIRELINH